MKIEEEEMTLCPFCKNIGEKCLNTLGNSICTREEGHTGDHIACGGIVHDITRWKEGKPWVRYNINLLIEKTGRYNYGNKRG